MMINNNVVSLSVVTEGVDKSIVHDRISVKNSKSCLSACYKIEFISLSHHLLQGTHWLPA